MTQKTDRNVSSAWKGKDDMEPGLCWDKDSFEMQGNRIHKLEMQLFCLGVLFICLFVFHLRTNWAAKRDYVTVVWTSFQIQISHKMVINKTCTFMDQILGCFFVNSRRIFYLIYLLLLSISFSSSASWGTFSLQHCQKAEKPVSPATGNPGVPLGNLAVLFFTCRAHCLTVLQDLPGQVHSPFCHMKI